jgi:disulfide bond formation protein DsbB
MENFVDFVNKFLSVGTIFLQLTIVFLVLNLVFYRSRENKVLLFAKKYTFILGFLVALGAVVCTLFYSEIVGYPPCELCWIQRIFLYPQLVLFGMELYKRERSIIDFSIVFAVLGSITSIYHIFVESGIAAGPACADPSSGGVSCAVRYIYEFGYMTMPIMALTLSLFIIVILLNYKYMTRIK